MVILLKEEGSKGSATAQDNEKGIGTMTFSIAGKELIIIDSTYVDPEYKGKGLGKKMLYKIVEMARHKKIKIIPLCPFASAMFRQSDDIRDVLKS
jgi:predicted GNAT family acetyltransferase